MAKTSRTNPARRASAAAVLLATLAVVLGLGITLATPAQARSHAVVIDQYAYSPASLTIDQGDTVTWTNQDVVEHDVVVTRGRANFRSPLLGTGESWSHTFTAAGSYAYICSLHPDMKASVTARPRASAPAVPASPKTTTHDEAHPPAAATQAKPTEQRSSRTARPARAKAATPPATEAAAPAQTEQIVAPLEQSGATLDPLLIVAGVSTAVMVFCLLLMTSRPVVRAAEVDPDASAARISRARRVP